MNKPPPRYARLYLSDCVEAMRSMPAESVDAVVCDPPYGIGFMGKEWDSFDHGDTGRNANFQAWSPVWATAAFRVLRPGGHIVAFGGARTSHRLACAIEDAGFEIRDSLAWLYGSGFPKSLNVQQAINKAARGTPQGFMAEQGIPRGDDEGEWEGFGTALKPAQEPVVVARKPLIGTVAANVLAHGTGAMNIDGCRVNTNGEQIHAVRSNPMNREGVVGTDLGFTANAADVFQAAQAASIERTNTLGRWPPNVLLSHSAECECTGSGPEGHEGHEGQEGLVERHTRGESVPVYRCVEGCPVAALDAQAGAPGVSRYFPIFNFDPEIDAPFLYQAKAARKEREAGCAALPDVILARSEGAQAAEKAGAESYTGGSQDIGLNRVSTVKNNHPTVKPVALMRWLCRLVTPPGGTVLDPFLGSGTTGIAALLEGFNFVGCEREADYLIIAEARIAHHAPAAVLLGPDDPVPPLNSLRVSC